MRLLAIDNDPIVIETLVQLLLAHTEHEVIAALTAQAALEVIDKPKVAKFDCILMDVAFAEYDGYTLLRQIRNHPDYEDVPIMVLTAKAGKAHIDAAFAAGASDYMNKPFEVNALLGRLAILTAPKTVPAQVDLDQAAPAFDSPVALSTPLRIFDAANFIDKPALDNYARQLSRATLYGSSAYALAVRDIAALHDTLSPFDFHSMVNDVADAIGAEMRECQTLIAYAGNGIFVGLAESNWRPRMDHVMNHVNARLAEADIGDGDGHVIDVRVSAGQAIRLAWKSGRSVIDALNQAEHSADRARVAFGKLRQEFWFMDRSA
ncbi:MAG: response regulator [Pseudomonadota bacterium]